MEIIFDLFSRVNRKIFILSSICLAVLDFLGEQALGT